MRRAAILLAVASLAAGCSSEPLERPDMSALDDIQKSFEEHNQSFPLPDACELVKDPDPGLLGGGTLQAKDDGSSETSASCTKQTTFGEAGISTLSVQVSALPSLGAPRSGYEEVLKRVEGEECEILPGVEEIACLAPGFVNRLDVGRGPYRVVVIFRFAEAGEKENRRFMEETAARVSTALG